MPVLRLVLSVLDVPPQWRLMLAAAAFFLSGQSSIAAPSPAAGPWTPISQIQGTGAVSPLNGERVTTQGVVTLRLAHGYFIQDPSGDGDPRSSEGVMVFTRRLQPPEVGQLVRVTAVVTEYNPGAPGNPDTSARTVTQLHKVSDVRVLSSGHSVAPVGLRFPITSDDMLEQLEGMRVSVPEKLTVTGNHGLGLFGQLTLSARGRLYWPTERVPPGEQARRAWQEDAKRSLLLDDGSNTVPAHPVPYLGDHGTVRSGDTVQGLTGVIDYGLTGRNRMGAGRYKLHPAQAPVFSHETGRPDAPNRKPGELRVASLNVQNYFTTLADGQRGCGPRLKPADCRGAKTQAEFALQQRQLVQALMGLDADIVGLMEIENDLAGAAVQSLADAVNQQLGRSVYAVVPQPDGNGGDDAIRVAMLYRHDRVTRVNDSLSDTHSVHHRPPLAQAFNSRGGPIFTVVVSHFKSRRCDKATGFDLDQSDLQGCFNVRRVRQADALVRWIDSAKGVKQHAGSNKVLLIGDLNAHTLEDPLRTLAAQGFADQVARFDSNGHTYVFDAMAGRLDHVLANAAMSPHVERAMVWHINADEPSLLDFRAQPAAGASSSSASVYRSSDHDPVLTILRFSKGP